MPNWTINTIKTKKKDILPTFINEEGKFDFNLLIPMPSELNMEDGSVTDEAIAYFVTNRLTVPYNETDLNKLIFNCFSENWAKDLTERLAREIEEEPEYYTPQKLDNLYKMGGQYLSNLNKYGHFTWYGWCCQHWSTKWNACRTEFDAKHPTEVRFETAWAVPKPIFKKLCELFPNEYIKFICEHEEGILEEYINDHGYLLLTNKQAIEFDEDYF